MLELFMVAALVAAVGSVAWEARDLTEELRAAPVRAPKARRRG